MATKDEQRAGAKSLDQSWSITTFGILLAWIGFQYHLAKSPWLETVDLGVCFFMIVGLLVHLINMFTYDRVVVTDMTIFVQIMITAVYFTVSNVIGYYLWARGFKSIADDLTSPNLTKLWVFLGGIVSLAAVIALTLFATSVGNNNNAFKKDGKMSGKEARAQYTQVGIFTGWLLAFFAFMFRNMIMSRLLEDNAQNIYNKSREGIMEKLMKRVGDDEDQKQRIRDLFEKKQTLGLRDKYTTEVIKNTIGKLEDVVADDLADTFENKLLGSKSRTKEKPSQIDLDAAQQIVAQKEAAKAAKAAAAAEAAAEATRAAAAATRAKAALERQAAKT